MSFDGQDQISIEGTIERSGEVDVFDIGPLSAGDRLEVTCKASSGSGLDPVVALFDADQFRVFWNDDLDFEAADFNAGFQGSIRYDSERHYLAVASSRFSFTTGAYELSAKRKKSAGLDPVSGQIVILQWDAAEAVRVSGTDYGDLPEFDAAAVDALFEGQTAELQDLMFTIIEDDFLDYDVTILTTDEAVPNEDFTTIFFGVSTTQSIFGISDDVDFYNAASTDNAIVFLQSFTGLSNDLDEIAQAIANVVSHEIGHTLGLMHNDDPKTLMDNTGEDESLLVDQDFATAEIVDFPIGLQNSSLLLLGTVGERSTGLFGKHGLFGDGHLRCGTCGAALARRVVISDQCGSSGKHRDEGYRYDPDSIPCEK